MYFQWNSKNGRKRDLIQRLELSFDVDRLEKDACAILEKFDFLWERKIKQLMVTCRASDRDPDFDGIGKQESSVSNEDFQKEFCQINPRFAGTYLEEVWRQFPYRVGRVRLMVLHERMCYSLHTDAQPRYHLALRTHEKCYMVYEGHPRWYRVPRNGNIYLVHTDVAHTAFNAGEGDRVHLVFDSCEGYAPKEKKSPRGFLGKI
jgi:hypothetical protein